MIVIFLPEELVTGHEMVNDLPCLRIELSEEDADDFVAAVELALDQLEDDDAGAILTIQAPDDTGETL